MINNFLFHNFSVRKIEYIEKTSKSVYIICSTILGKEIEEVSRGRVTDIVPRGPVVKITIFL